MDVVRQRARRGAHRAPGDGHLCHARAIRRRIGQLPEPFPRPHLRRRRHRNRRGDPRGVGGHAQEEAGRARGRVPGGSPPVQVFTRVDDSPPREHGHHHRERGGYADVEVPLDRHRGGCAQG